MTSKDNSFSFNSQSQPEDPYRQSINETKYVKRKYEQKYFGLPEDHKTNIVLSNALNKMNIGEIILVSDLGRLDKPSKGRVMKRLAGHDGKIIVCCYGSKTDNQKIYYLYIPNRSSAIIRKNPKTAYEYLVRNAEKRRVDYQTLYVVTKVSQVSSLSTRLQTLTQSTYNVISLKVTKSLKTLKNSDKLDNLNKFCYNVDDFRHTDSKSYTKFGF